MIKEATHTMMSFLLAIRGFCLLALAKLVWIVCPVSSNLLIVGQPKKILNSYKFPSIFLITIVVLAIAACSNSTTEIAARNTSLTTLQTPAETQVVSHALGKVEIPVNPQRVVVLDDQVLLDPIVALIEPVGALSCSGCEEDFRGIPSDLVANVVDVGTGGEPSLERILSLKPDLIVAREWQKNSYELLSKIAPTVVVDYYSIPDFKERLRYFGKLLGKNDRAEKLLTQYEERIRQLQQRLGKQLETRTISLISLNGSTDIFSTSKPGLFTSSQIFGDIGLKLTQIQQEQKEDNLTLSIETLPKYDADSLFIVTYQLSTKSKEADSEPLFFLKQPIWSQLRAVQNKRAYKVYWDVGGPIGANRVIDDLSKYLVKEGSQK